MRKLLGLGLLSIFCMACSASEETGLGEPPLLEYELNPDGGVSIRHVRGYPIQRATLVFTTANHQPATACRLVSEASARLSFQEDYLLLEIAPFARNSLIEVGCPEAIHLRPGRYSLSDGSLVEKESSNDLQSAGFNNPVTLWGTFLGGMAGLILLSIMFSVALEYVVVRVSNEDVS
ncbi:MAG TPA: hypothetical protein DEB46_07335 [Myxococcales bacterium]|nr:hypothetical protein [Myxococcales bacterium]